MLTTEDQPHYTLGLGQLSPERPLKSTSDPQEQEELLFIKREKDREEEFTKVENGLLQPIFKKVTYSKPDRTGAIRRLFDQTDALAKTRGKIAT